jgi:hypothetical protein
VRGDSAHGGDKSRGDTTFESFMAALVLTA